jgi:L-seryl-tRNA(Ser) seleniumtransferase
LGGRDDATPRELSGLPAVHELAAPLVAQGAARPLAMAAARRAIAERREALLAGESPGVDLGGRATELLERLGHGSLRRVINATGVILHTNLGRAPLASSAADAVARAAAGYSNLELELDTGTRGSRQAHVEGLLCELTGAPAALVVNNGAAAVLLAAAALTGEGPTAGARAIVVSRGQLVEIGGGFRIPDVIAQSGARLIEVGTTNRTRLRDYESGLAAAGDTPAVILRVHPSNFRTIGFVEEVSIEELCSLGVPVIDDVGSGVLTGAIGIPAMGDEPPLRRSIEAGAAVVCCSADKLLGGPQAGLLVGGREAIAAAHGHPLARALRIDKLSLAALEATLLLYRDPARARREIPVLAMLEAGEARLIARAQRLAAELGANAEIVRVSGRVGGGALPLLELEGPAIALRAETDPITLMRALRDGDPPVIGRIRDGRVLLDPRTIADDEVAAAGAAVHRALRC